MIIEILVAIRDLLVIGTFAFTVLVCAAVAIGLHSGIIR